MRSDINFNHLEVFITLAKCLSFSQTSQILSVAQPAISRQIQLLESYFGEQLFIRNRKNVKLTSFGKNLIKQIAPLFEEICQRIDHISNQANSLSGEIIFGCFYEVGEKIFVKALSLFHQSYPDLKINIKFLKGAEIIEQIKDGTIDIGIVSEKIIHDDIRCYEVIKQEIMLVTSKKNKEINGSDIKNIPLISYRDNDPLLSYYIQKVFPKTKSKSINPKLIVNSHRSMIDLIIAHNYCAVLPSLSITNELNSKQLISIGEKTLKSSLYLIYLEKEYQPKKVQLLVSFLKDYL